MRGGIAAAAAAASYGQPSVSSNLKIKPHREKHTVEEPGGGQGMVVSSSPPQPYFSPRGFLTNHSTSNSVVDL